MKIIIALVVIISILISNPNYFYGETEETIERILVIREGKQSKKNYVTVEAYLVGDILEVIVGARMYAKKPKIYDVELVGPKIGRLHYQAKEVLVATTQEDDPYEITKTDGIFKIGKRKRTRKPKGTLTKELFKIKIPKDKIISGKRYRLGVELESNLGRPLKFKFDLEDFAEIVLQSEAMPQ